MCLLNCQSSRNKSDDIADLIITNNMDILVLTETWLKMSGDETIIATLTPSGFGFHQLARQSRGGGVAIIFRDYLNIKIVPSQSPVPIAYEHIEFVVKHAKTATRVIALYRPPPSRKNGLTIAKFTEEFSKLLETTNQSKGRLVILGDFNIHFDKPDNPDTKHMLKLLDLHNLRQHVAYPTQKAGHILDWVLSRNTEDCVTGTRVLDLQISDHFLVTLDLDTIRPPRPVSSVRCRNIKKMDTDAFRNDLEHSILLANPPENCDQFAELYSSVLCHLLDKHAPAKVKIIPLREESPWTFTPEVMEAKTERRRAERQWRHSHLEIHRQMYVTARNKVTTMIQRMKRNFFNSKISESSSDPRALYTLLFGLLGKKSDHSLPSDGDPQDVADSFSDYFNNKIAVIREELKSAAVPVGRNQKSTFQQEQLCTLEPFTQDEIHSILKKAKPTSCALDPVPTRFLYEHIDILLPTITRLVNTSLSAGVMPANCKKALVKPLLKKTGLDPDVRKNYRPVSNLPFISKVIEKAVCSRLSKHLADYGLYEPLQSAYRPHHSTETALVKVLNDIRLGIDDGNVALLTLLDLSAAFDTIDHQLLVSRLECEMGIAGTALQWFKSYLADRSQTVQIGKDHSAATELKCGVPQGSVLGPVLFSLYTKPLGCIIENHKIQRHFYADDSQLSSIFKPSPAAAASTISTTADCCDEIKTWMTTNMLKLNNDKTEAILLGPAARRKNTQMDSITVGTSVIPLASSVRNLGVMLDSELTMVKHVDHISKICFFHIRNIGKIRKYLTRDATITLVLSLVMSRLDYCNCVLTGAPKSQINQLQRIQNTAARIVSQSSRSDHITPVLKDLHWLPIQQRVTYKTLCLAYQCIAGTAPGYLCDLLHLYSPSRPLRSASKLLLKIPTVKSCRYGLRSFSYTAAMEWNKLPTELRSCPEYSTFKALLKTHLFRQAYP